MSTQPLDHIARINPPWRDDVTTVCGRPASDVKSVVTRDVIAARIRKDGKQRAAYTVCMTCAERSTVVDWWATPVDVITQGNSRWGPPAAILADELRALGLLMQLHPEEYAQLLASARAGDALTVARRKKAATPRFQGLTL